jgi:EAL domain-containing protein (putative c-di-GMP-specific phosphodiesterase class I)
MSPADFIPIAEETGLIVEIGQWVLNTACRLCKKIENKYQKSIIISVNISPIQLRHKEFINMVLDAVKLSEISFCKLELEITENHFIDNADEAIGVLKKLREAGIRIALDDFGTGYSSLSYLKKLPINLLKIDKSFVDEIDCQSVQQSLTSSIITLVHNLNIETIAEGIETCEQYEYLLESKCDNLQGYYLGKPVPEHLVDEVIKNHWKV